jgi:hypothetical protein
MSPVHFKRKLNGSLRGVLLCGMSSQRPVAGPSVRLSWGSPKSGLILALAGVSRTTLVSDDEDGLWLAQILTIDTFPKPLSRLTIKS